MWFEKWPKLLLVTQVVSAISLSLIFTLYVAPTKDLKADLLVALLLVIMLAAFGLRRSAVAGAIMPLAPLLCFLLYLLMFDLLAKASPGAGSYIKELLIGFMPFLLLYVVFRNKAAQAPLLVVSIFLVPGLIHLGYMYLDIALALQHGDVAFMPSSKHGLLETIKDVPRVGRRYLSLALLHLLCGGLLLAWHLRSRRTRFLTWGLISLSILSLVLLDARVGYASVLIGIVLLMLAVGPARAWRAMRSLLPSHLPGALLLAGFLIAAVGVGYSAGKSRWGSLNESMAPAVHDVFYTDVEVAQRPCVDADFWNAPIEDIDECHLKGHFPCRIDQSAYLRTAWVLSGLQSLVQHPLGLGYFDNYMARLWHVSGGKGKYERSDIFLVMHMVSFGVPTIIFVAVLMLSLLRSLRLSLQVRYAPVLLLAIGAIILICVRWILVDVFDKGLWLYLMAPLGMYYGLLHSKEWRTGTDKNSYVKKRGVF